MNPKKFVSNRNLCHFLQNPKLLQTSNDGIAGYVSALPGGDETMLHSVHFVGIRRLAISDSPVSILLFKEVYWVLLMFK